MTPTLMVMAAITELLAAMQSKLVRAVRTPHTGSLHNQARYHTRHALPVRVPRPFTGRTLKFIMSTILSTPALASNLSAE